MDKNGRATRLWHILEEPQTQGQRIRFWRLVAGWPQDRLGEEASRIAKIKPALSKSFISLLEGGRTQPSVASLHGIALALGVTLDYLVTGEAGYKRQTPKVNLKPLFRQAKQIQADRIDAGLRRLQRRHAEDLANEVTAGAQPREAGR